MVYGVKSDKKGNLVYVYGHNNILNSLLQDCSGLKQTNFDSHWDVNLYILQGNNYGSQLSILFLFE